MYYYAEINSNCEVIDVHQLSAESTNANYIAITAEQYTTASVLGKFYNKLTGAFEILDIENVGYVGDTNVVQMVGTNGKLLSTHLDNMQVEMNAKAVASNLATVATSGSYNDLSNKPTIPTVPSSLPANGGNADTVDNKHASDFATADHTHNYANASHTHAQTEITGLATALSGKSDTSHTHTNYATAENLSALETTVNGKANASHTHAQSEITGLATALNDKASASHTHSDLQTAIDGKANATHTHTEYASASHTHSNATTSASGLMSASDKTRLDGIEAGANKTVIDSALSSTSTNPVQNKVINTALAGKSDTTHTHDSRYYTGEQVDELLSGFAGASHTHTASALLTMASALFGTNAGGGVQYSYTSGDVLKAISAYPAGFHTVYAAAGCSTNPDSTESYRYVIHKTGATIGWILAWGSEGSVYTNYQYGDNQFKGWRCLYDASPAPLWSGGANGGYYMTEGHTVTPSKKLSECHNGWILLWSDYDTGGQANNTDFCTTIIPKRAYTGQVWNGGMWYCDIPSYAAGTATDSEIRIIKVLQIYDAKIVGTANNAVAPRNDVVLRAVYEW